MTDRESLSKKLRFEIFKRDGFTCQYCGRTPPNVILEVDHITPVVNGGTNDEMNLITACFDCNRGKGKRELGNIAPRPDADLKWLEMQQEIKELERYQEAKSKRDGLRLSIADSLCETWGNAFKSDFTPNEMEFIKLLSKFSPEMIEEAIYISSSKCKSSYMGYQWKYMCGVLWNMLRGETS